MEECNCDQSLALIAREKRILEAIKNCFKLPECTAGHQIVDDADYNKLVTVINESV